MSMPTTVTNVLMFFNIAKAGHLRMAFMNHCFLRKPSSESNFLCIDYNKDQNERKKSFTKWYFKLILFFLIA